MSEPRVFAAAGHRSAATVSSTGGERTWEKMACVLECAAWERWRIVCLAALSVEDIEDIYLFGTMITGILLIGLGFALGY